MTSVSAQNEAFPGVSFATAGSLRGESSRISLRSPRQRSKSPRRSNSSAPCARDSANASATIVRGNSSITTILRRRLELQRNHRQPNLCPIRLGVGVDEVVEGLSGLRLEDQV